MARGDIVVFDQYLVDVGLKRHDLNGETFKVAFVDATIVPSATIADPRWGAGGSTDFSANEQTGGNFPAGGITLANNTFALDGGLAKFDADDPAVFAQDPANPTDIHYAIIYNDSDAGKRAVGFMDMRGAGPSFPPIDASGGSVTINWNAAGIVTHDQA